jgi:hypothetical protein
MEVIGQLRTASKLPYYILSGRGCQECDARTSIYIHSPSDGPMKDEGNQARFSYPGRRVSYLDGSSLVYEARMFFGNCAAGHLDAVIWFERFLGDDGQWHDGVFLAEVKDDSLVSGEMARQAPDLREVEDAVRRMQCRELQGRDGFSEP